VAARAEDSLGYLLKHAYQRYSERNDAALEPLGIDGRELGVLLTVDDGSPRSQQEIAAKLGVDRTTMVGMLDALEAKGFLARRQDPTDRRRNVVALTESGSDLLPRAVRVSEAVGRRFLAPITDGDALRAALRALVNEAEKD
jgi:DNA-binding MarR family transcriptional regulator